MATYSGPVDLKIEYDDSGDSPVDITAFVLTVNEVAIEGMTEEVHPLGQSWEKNRATGVAKIGPVEITGLYDTATGGPDDLFADRATEGPSTASRTLTFTWQSGVSTSFETFLVSYNRSADRNALTKYKVRLIATEAATESS